jgi:hypothetical protein
LGIALLGSVLLLQDDDDLKLKLTPLFALLTVFAHAMLFGLSDVVDCNLFRGDCFNLTDVA